MLSRVCKFEINPLRGLKQRFQLAKRFHVRQKKREAQLLYRLPTFRIIFGKEVDQVGRILMWPMTRPHI